MKVVWSQNAVDVLIVEKWAANLMKTTQVQARICSIEWARYQVKGLYVKYNMPCGQVARINV